MKKLIKYKIFSFFLLTYFNYLPASINKEMSQQELINAIHNHNIDTAKLALAMGANSSLKNDKTNNSILVDALIELKNLHHIKYRILLYKIVTGFLVPSSLALIIGAIEADSKIIHSNKLYTLLLKISGCSILTLITLFFVFKAMHSHRDYKNSLKIVKEILSTPGTIIDEKEIQEFINSKCIPEEASSMLKAILASQSTSKSTQLN